jgi:hypothetical protein
LPGVGVGARLGICGRGEKLKLGENGRFRLLEGRPLVEVGVNGGREVAGEMALCGFASWVESGRPTVWSLGGWVADVGVGGGAA